MSFKEIPQRLTGVSEYRSALSSEILIDQGLGDKFLLEQLHPHLFEAACAYAKQPLVVRRHETYDYENSF